jgi:Xaa-Pro aminopeptidase
LKLAEALKHTPYPRRFLSSAPLISRLRSRKTATELERMMQAVQETEKIFSLVAPFLQAGITERAVSEMVNAELIKRQLKPAWSDNCPDVKFGPKRCLGHGSSDDTILEVGFLASLDMGVSYQDYCSDLQRLWYLRRPGETSVPNAARRAFWAVRGALNASKAMLKPGLQGWQVDAIARAFLTKAGYPEYQHALGYSVGRHIHDGGPLLGPRWMRYGDTPYYTLEEGVIFSLKAGVMTEYGGVSLEDEALVTLNGSEWFSHPQEEIYLL